MARTWSSDGGRTRSYSHSIRVRGTFIEVSEPRADRGRTRSEPDLSDAYKAGISVVFDEANREFADNLSDKLSSLWSVQLADRSRLGGSPGGSDEALSARDLLEGRSDAGRSEADVTSSSGACASGDVPPGPPGGNRPRAGASAADASKAACSKADRGLDAATDVVSRALVSCRELPHGTTRGELAAQMRSRLNHIHDKLKQHKRQKALQVIQELPEQVEEILQVSGSSVFQEVQDSIQLLRDQIRPRAQPGQPRVDKAVEIVESIPDNVWNSFEINVAEAKRVVRRRIEDLCQDLSCGDASNKEVVSQIQGLPAEVQQLADNALQSALLESQAHAQAQFERAELKLPEYSNTLQNAKQQMVHGTLQLHVASAGAVHNAREAVNRPVEDMVALVNDFQESEMRGVVANQVVADMLLRAKTAKLNDDAALPLDLHAAQGEPIHGADTVVDPGVSGRASAAAAPPLAPRRSDRQLFAGTQQTSNPGSVGHPELCPRPCLYVATGSCMKGAECDFCHFEHPKRPAHLDKRHREMLRKMPFRSCAAVMMPVLREKVQAMRPPREAMDLVDSLEQLCCRMAGMDAGDWADGASAATADARAHRNERMLIVALRALSLRALLSSLHRMSSPHPQAGEVEQLVLALLRCLCALSATRQFVSQ